MADRIKGITIEIGGDAKPLQTALKSVDKELKTTQSTLKDVNKLLKLDPGNVELLTQKQKNLESAISGTKERLNQLKEAQNGVEKGTAEWDGLQREIIATGQDLKSLEEEHRAFGSVAAQQIKAAGAAMQDFGDKVSAAGDKLAPISGAAAGALTALGGMAYKAVVASDDLNTLAKQTGVSTEELQKMQYASDMIDVSVDDITGALRKLKPKITDDNKALAELGVSVRDADGNMRSATDVFYDSITALSKIENETERDQKAMELFGKGADSLAGIIDDGGAALRDYGKQAEELGVILDQDTLDALNETNDVIDVTKAQITATMGVVGSKVVPVVAPLLTKVADLISRVADKLSKLTPKQTETILKVTALVAALAPVLKIGGTIITGVGSVISVVGSLVGVLGGPLTIAIAAVVAAGVLLYKNWDTVKATAIAVKDGVVAAWNNLKTSVTNTVNNVRTSVTDAWNGIRNGVVNTVEGIRYGVTSAWENIRYGVTNTVTNVRNSVVSVWDGMRDRVNGVIDSIKGKIDTFKSKFDELKNKVSDAVSRIKSAFSFSWSLPHIKLPHFRVQGGKWPYGLGGEGYLPSIKVDWYKRAYENAVMFKSPTVLQTPQGYKGFGDGNGAEIVMGLDKLRQLVGGNTGNTTINVYAAPGMNVNELADKVQQRLVMLNKQKEAAYA